MSLEIIGAGFGRTGTLSLKIALEKLGCGPCYHMMEVLGKPTHPRIWSEAGDGRFDWDALFEGYASAVDWPSCTFWREQADHYPDAKVLLSVRPSDRWYESIMATIYHPLVMEVPENAPPVLRDQLAMARKLILHGTFDGKLEERDYAIGVYERHNRAVRDAFADSGRLLVYEVSEDWGPLSEFVGKPVPDEEFPRLNDKESFRGRFRLDPSPDDGVAR